MKLIIIGFTLLVFSFSVRSQEVFTQGEHVACNPDSIFKNSPTFNENGIPPKNSNEINITEYFKTELGKIKTKDKKVVFKFILDCNGIITDVWVFKSTGIIDVDNRVIELIKVLKLWKPANFKKKNVDFEMTFLGAVKKGRLYLGTQMHPPKEWSEVK